MLGPQHPGLASGAGGRLGAGGRRSPSARRRSRPSATSRRGSGRRPCTAASPCAGSAASRRGCPILVGDGRRLARGRPRRGGPPAAPDADVAVLRRAAGRGAAGHAATPTGRHDSSTSCWPRPRAAASASGTSTLLKLRAAAASALGAAPRRGSGRPRRRSARWPRDQGALALADAPRREPVVIPENLPDYVDRGGRQVWRPPYMARDTEVFGFVVECRREAIDPLLRRDLVEPSGGAVDYRCASDRVVDPLRPDRAASRRPTTATASADTCPSSRSRCGASPPTCSPAAASSGTCPTSSSTPGRPPPAAARSTAIPSRWPSSRRDYPERLATPRQDDGAGRRRSTSYGPDEKAVPAADDLRERRAGAGAGGRRPGMEAFDGAARARSSPTSPSTRSLPYGARPAALGVDHLGRRSAAPAAAPAGSGMGRAPRPEHVLRPRAVRRPGGARRSSMIASPMLVFLKQFRDVTCPTQGVLPGHRRGAARRPRARRDLPASSTPSLYRITVCDYASHPIATRARRDARGQPVSPTFAFHARFDFDIAARRRGLAGARPDGGSAPRSRSSAAGPAA